MYLQQLRNHRQLLWVTDVYGVIPVGLPLVADVPQVKDGRQQRKDPVQQVKHCNIQKMLERKRAGRTFSFRRESYRKDNLMLRNVKLLKNPFVRCQQVSGSVGAQSSCE